jgi:hypothetical protein
LSKIDIEREIYDPGINPADAATRFLAHDDRSRRRRNVDGGVRQRRGTRGFGDALTIDAQGPPLVLIRLPD